MTKYTVILLLLLSFLPVQSKDKIIIETVGKFSIKLVDGKVIQNQKDSVFVDITNVPCLDYTEIVEDKMTGKVELYSKNTIVIKNKESAEAIAISSFDTKDGMALTIKAVGAGNCIEKEQIINVLFRDGSRMEMKHFGSYNCDKTHTIVLEETGIGLDELNQLRSKETETFRVWTNNGYVQVDFTPEQSKDLMNTINCMLFNVRELKKRK